MVFIQALPPVRKPAKLVIDQFTKPVGLEYLKKKKPTVRNLIQYKLLLKKDKRA